MRRGALVMHVRVLLAVALFAALVLARCGKDPDPGPSVTDRTEPTRPTVPTTKTPTERDRNRSNGDPKTSPANAATTLLPRTIHSPRWPAPVGAEEAAKLVLAQLRIGSLDGLLELVGKLVVNLPAEIPSLLLERMKLEFGLTDITWLDRGRQIHVLVTDPKAFVDGNVYVLPISNRDAVIKSLNLTDNNSGHGHAFEYEYRHETIHGDFLDRHLVLAREDFLFPKLRAFIGGLVTQPAGFPLALDLDITNLRRLFAGEIQDQKRQVKALYHRLLKRPVGPDSALAGANIDALASLIESTRRVTLGLALSGANARLTVNLTPQPGSGLMSAVSTASTQQVGLAARSAADSWLVAASVLDVRSAESLRLLQKTSTEIWANTLGLSADETRGFVKLVEELSELATGDTLFALSGGIHTPLALRSVNAVTDAMEVRKRYGELFELLQIKSFLALKELLGGRVRVPLTKLERFDDLSTFLNEAGAPLGIKTSVASELTEETQVDSLVVELKWPKLKAAVGATDDKIRKILGDRFEIALAYRHQTVALAAEPDAVREAKALVVRPDASTLSPAPGAADLAKGKVLLLAMRVKPMINALGGLLDLGRGADLGTKMADETSVMVTGTSDGKALRLTLDVPLDLLEALF